MRDIILHGIQGSGKGTQADLLIAKYGYQLFSTGARLREQIALQTDLGNRIADIVNSGILVPDEIIVEIIESFLKNLPTGQHILFDAVPRTLPQYEAFNPVMDTHGRERVAICIDISEAETFRRLSVRRTCPKCGRGYPPNYPGNICEKDQAELSIRKDENPEGIQKRLEEYYTKTVPMIVEYEKIGNLLRINGEQSIEKVHADIVTALEKCSAV